VDLRHALARAEIEVVYQPEIDLATGRPLAFEALVRWRRAGHGWVPPAVFLPLAEETGMILEIGRAVLRDACRQARWWREMVPGLSPAVSVNLSIGQLRNPSLVEEIKLALDEFGLEPSSLSLEIAQATAADEGGSLESRLHELKSLGVRLTIDDFGVGQSTIGDLKRLPIDRLKIDRALVAEVGHRHLDAQIVEAIAALARALGLDLVAEGVERSEQPPRLRELGCHAAQGYYFSQPLTGAEVGDFLRRTSRPEPTAAPALDERSLPRSA
jgi:EAL domain-containing protein (putative c-di-GMP-specific phosphodiesterase class I)